MEAADCPGGRRPPAEHARLENTPAFDASIAQGLEERFALPRTQAEHILKPACADRAWKNTDRDTYQAMEGFVHNLNTMHSRAGAQTPFSSINYGTDTSPEGRMAMRNVLLAPDAGLGHGETPHFPHPHLQGEGGGQLQPRRPQLRPVPAQPAR